VALPGGSEGEHEEVADERALLAHGDRLPAALPRHLAEAGAHLLVELGERRDLLQVLVVEPPGHLPLELLVQHEAHVDRAHDAALRAPVGDQLVDGGHVLRWGGELPTRMITFFASLRHLSWRIAHSRPSFTASSQSPPPSATMPSRKACTFFTLKVRPVHLTTKASLCRGPPFAPWSSS